MPQAQQAHWSHPRTPALLAEAATALAAACIEALKARGIHCLLWPRMAAELLQQTVLARNSILPLANPARFPEAACP